LVWPNSDFESPSEEDVIRLAPEPHHQSIRPLQDEIETLMATVFTRQDEKIAALESTQETPADNQLIQLWLIHELREAAKKDAQPLQMDRADILRALIAANGGKMLLSSARQKMHLRKDQFSQMLKGCNFVEVKPLHSDKRKMVIILKNELF